MILSLDGTTVLYTESFTDSNHSFSVADILVETSSQVHAVFFGTFNGAIRQTILATADFLSRSIVYRATLPTRNLYHRVANFVNP
jgi:hypothetical protein